METGSGFFDSTGGHHLFEQWWRPDSTPRAVVAICHGFAEHGGRYADVADYLCSRGYAVEALDLRGHGQSDGPRVYVRSFNGYLDDLSRFLKNVQARNAGLPVFLLGHSMGGGVAALFVIARKPKLAGLILSGPALRQQLGAEPWYKRAAFKAMSPFGRLRLPALSAENVSRDPEVVRAYSEDPLVTHHGATVGLIKAGVRASDRIERDMEQVALPLLIVHGTEDQLVPTDGSEELYRRALSEDKTLKLYEGLYHEVMNEPERLDVLGDIGDWLDARTGPVPAA